MCPATPRTRLSLSEIPLRVVEGGEGVIATNMSARITVQVQVTTSVAVHSDDNNDGSNPDGQRARPATRDRDEPRPALVALKWDRMRSSTTPAPDPTPFSHAYSLPGPLFASIPSVILAFPQYPRTALRDYVERNPHARGTCFFFLSTRYSVRLSLSTAPQFLNRSHTKGPHAESSFFFTQAQRCMSTNLAIMVPTPGPT